jgi:hypothetical protein
MRLAEPDMTGTLVVEVADDGVGFDPDVAYPGASGSGGHAGAGAAPRGRFTVDSSPTGSTVRVELPDILRRLRADAPHPERRPGSR